MLLNNLVNQTLCLVSSQAGKVVANVGDVITTRIVCFAGVHRVMGEVATRIVSLFPGRGKGNAHIAVVAVVFPHLELRFLAGDVIITSIDDIKTVVRTW